MDKRVSKDDDEQFEIGIVYWRVFECKTNINNSNSNDNNGSYRR